MIARLKKYLTYLVILTFPVMSLVNVTPTLFMNLSLADAFVLLLGLVWLIDIRRFKLKTHFPYVWYFLAFVVVLLISNWVNMHTAINSAGVTGVLAESVKVITNAAFFFVAYNAVGEDRKDLRNIFIIWITGLYIFMLYGFYATGSRLLGLTPWMFNRTLGNHSRFLGTLTDPNAAALYLSVSFFMVLIWKRHFATTMRSRVALTITNILVFVGIVLTMSRGGMIGFLGGLTLWVLFNIKAYIKYVHLVPLVLCLLTAILFVDTQLFYNSTLRTLTSRVQDATSETGTLHARINLSLASINMGLDHPLTGIGRGNFTLNSQEYLVEQGVDWEKQRWRYTNLVSHNTVAGVFAEMGVPGLCVFLSLFVIGLIKFIRNKQMHWRFKVLILSLWGSIFIQSLSISLENARVFWITAGLMLCFTDRSIPFTCEADEAPKAKGIPFKIAVAVVSLFLCVFFYGYTALRYTHNSIDISNQRHILTYQTQHAGRYTLRYSVNSPKPGGEDLTTMEVSIRNAATDEIVNQVSYDETARGYGNLYFHAEEGDSFVIEFTGRDSSTINDIKIIDETSNTRVLAGCYPLLPESVYLLSQRNGYLVSHNSDTRPKKDLLETGLLPEDKQTVFGDVIRFKGVNVTQTPEGSTRFDFVFECVKEMEYDFTLWMHIVPNNINRLSGASLRSGYIWGDHKPETPTSTWQVGQEYVHSYTIHLEEGMYNPHFGFWLPPSDVQERIWLNTDTNQSGRYMGWFHVD